jgi:hypothetical protein
MWRNLERQLRHADSSPDDNAIEGDEVHGSVAASCGVGQIDAAGACFGRAT